MSADRPPPSDTDELMRLANEHQLFIHTDPGAWCMMSGYLQEGMQGTITRASPEHQLRVLHREKMRALYKREMFQFKMHVSLDATQIPPEKLMAVTTQIVELLCKNIHEKNGITNFKLIPPSTILTYEQTLQEEDEQEQANLKMLLQRADNQQLGEEVLGLHITEKAIRKLQTKIKKAQEIHRELKNPIVIYISPDTDINRFGKLCYAIQALLVGIPTDKRYNTAADLPCGQHFIFRTDYIPIALATAAGITYEGNYIDATGNNNKHLLNLICAIAMHSPDYLTLNRALLLSPAEQHRLFASETTTPAGFVSIPSDLISKIKQLFAAQKKYLPAFDYVAPRTAAVAAAAATSEREESLARSDGSGSSETRVKRK